MVNSMEYAKYLKESWDFYQPASTLSKCCCCFQLHPMDMSHGLSLRIIECKNDRKRVDALEMWCYKRLLQTKTPAHLIAADLYLRSRIMMRK